MNFYKRHLGDIAKATGHLSQGEMGAYDLLLDWCYSNEKALPLRMADVYRIGRAGSKAEKANVGRVLTDFFDTTPDGYTQKRVLEEMAKANAQAETNRAIAEERERKKRERKEHESLNGSSGKRGTNDQPSQTPDSRHHQEQDPSPSSSPPTPPPRSDDDEPVSGEQDLPSWVPRALWREFYRHRAVIRKPLSIPGQRQVVARLVELSEQGHDVAASLRQTMAAGLAIPVVPRFAGDARAGPSPQRMGKTAQAIQALEDMRHGNRLDLGRDFDGDAEAPAAVAGIHAGR